MFMNVYPNPKCSYDELFWQVPQQYSRFVEAKGAVIPSQQLHEILL